MAGLVDMWRAPIDTLSKAGRAMEGIEALLGGAAGGSFDLKVRTSAWCCAASDGMRTSAALQHRL